MTKQHSISLYTGKENKDIIVQAAKLVGLDYSAFCRMASLQIAREVLNKNQVEVNSQ